MSRRPSKKINDDSDTDDDKSIRISIQDDSKRNSRMSSRRNSSTKVT